MDLTCVTWRKSSRSGNNGGNCVEVAGLVAGVAVRDSKNRDGAKLIFTRAVLLKLANEVKAGKYDL